MKCEKKSKKRSKKNLFFLGLSICFLIFGYQTQRSQAENKNEKREEKAASQKLLDQEFWTLFEKGLEGVGLVPEDLNFEKRLAGDIPYQLPALITAMDQPAALPDIASSLVEQNDLEEKKGEILLQDLEEEFFQAGGAQEEWVKEQTRGFENSLSFLQGEIPAEKVSSLIRELVLFKVFYNECTEDFQELFGGKRLERQIAVSSSLFLLFESINRRNILEGSELLIHEFLTRFLKKEDQERESYKQVAPALEKLSWRWRRASQAFALRIKAFFSSLSELEKESFWNDKESLEIELEEEQKLVFASKGNTKHFYQKSPLIVIDFGGDDEYSGAVCAAGEGSPFCALFDFGQGNDRYQGWQGGDISKAPKYAHGPCAALGGFALLEDFGGDDVYSGQDISLAAAWCGSAHLIDHKGSDRYTSGQFAQGAAFCGWGELYDYGENNDRYQCARYGQGFGFVMGYGRIEDQGGADTYYAGGVYPHRPLLPDNYQSLSQGFGFGSRYGRYAGGIGLIVDRGNGNDLYSAEVYGQGSSYWYALGIAWDEGGHDRWNLTQYGQGAGIHLSAGILVDQGGNDHYVNPHGVGTGGAHDYAVGWLIDQGGNDSYFSNGIGQGLNNSVALLYDASGNDSYASIDEKGIGGGTNNSIGFLIDGGGKDFYTAPVSQGLWHCRGSYGMVMDVQAEEDQGPKQGRVDFLRIDQLARGSAEEPSANQEVESQSAKPEAHLNPQNLALEELEKLWSKATLWAVGENLQVVRDARRELVEEGNLEFLFSKLGVSSTLLIRGLRGTIPFFGREASDALLAKLESEAGLSFDTFQNILELLDIIRKQEKEKDLSYWHPASLSCLEKIQGRLEHERIYLLEKIVLWPGADLKNDLLPYLKSENNRTRLKAVTLLGQKAQGYKEAEALIEAILYDSYFAVRKKARENLNPKIKLFYLDGQHNPEKELSILIHEKLEKKSKHYYSPESRAYPQGEAFLRMKSLFPWQAETYEDSYEQAMQSRRPEEVGLARALEADLSKLLLSITENKKEEKQAGLELIKSFFQGLELLQEESPEKMIVWGRAYYKEIIEVLKKEIKKSQDPVFLAQAYEYIFFLESKELELD